jgi:hypothetical protein
MRACDRGRKIENAKAGKATCQMALIVFRYGHSQVSLDSKRSPSRRAAQATLRLEILLGKLSAARAFGAQL